jgi:hypothetical protein
MKTSHVVDFTRRIVGAIFFWMLLAASVALNLMQSQRLHSASEGRERLPRIGVVVQPIDARTADAQLAHIAYASERVPTILYYFSPRCGWCERNWDSVAALQRATGGRYRFVAVTTAGEAERRERAAGLPVPTYWRLSDDDRRAYQLSGTPHTLVISTEGRVINSWPGAYIGGTKTKLERYFQVSLPGVSSPSSQGRD